MKVWMKEQEGDLKTFSIEAEAPKEVIEDAKEQKKKMDGDASLSTYLLNRIDKIEFKSD